MPTLLTTDNATVKKALPACAGASMTAPGHAWPALLAQTQANREMALAIRGHTQASALLQTQALANCDAAAALPHAMRTHGDPSDHAPLSDELQCWRNHAQDSGRC